jgi:hypothetical protein
MPKPHKASERFTISYITRSQIAEELNSYMEGDWGNEPIEGPLLAKNSKLLTGKFCRWFAAELHCIREEGEGRDEDWHGYRMLSLRREALSELGYTIQDKG